MIERVLGHLAAHGIDDAVLSLGYRPDAFINAYPDGVDRRGPADLRRGAHARSTRPAPSASPPDYAGIDEHLRGGQRRRPDRLRHRRPGRLPPQRGAEGTIGLTPVDDPSALRRGPHRRRRPGHGLHREAAPGRGADQPHQRRHLRVRAVGARTASPRRSPGVDRAGDLPGPGGRRHPLRPGLRRLLARRRHPGRLPAGPPRPAAAAAGPARRHRRPSPDPELGCRGVDASARSTPCRARSSRSLLGRGASGRPTAHRSTTRWSGPGRWSRTGADGDRLGAPARVPGWPPGPRVDRLDRRPGGHRGPALRDDRALSVIGAGAVIASGTVVDGERYPAGS